MIYRKFQDLDLSLLGFGTMRLPVKPNGEIDEEQTAAMTDLAFRRGVNYIDTAYPYMQSKSEIVMGKILQNYPRDSFYLATKFPGHMLVGTEKPEDIFTEQLKKCRVDYFDFYLLHNVYENDISVYKDEKLGIINYLKEQKRLGRIKHLGFSCHADPDALEEFLEYAGDAMEFCQIQFNYMDWTLQQADKKYEILAKHNIPVWVMEPVRGGKLAALGEAQHAKLQAFRPGASDASFALRWVLGKENVRMILSGMSSLEQMEDNLNTFEAYDPLTAAEETALADIAEELKGSIPCTACRYCCDGCPWGWISRSLSASSTASTPATETPSACSLMLCRPKNRLPPASAADSAPRCAPRR